MTLTAVEQLLETVDRRLARVEQILPTLATKRDLDEFATKRDLDRFATKADLERFATREDLGRFATKDDLERFATKVALESVEGDLRIVLDAVLSLIVKVDANSDAIRSLTARLDVRS